jgi:hypothetical protein
VAQIGSIYGFYLAAIAQTNPVVSFVFAMTERIYDKTAKALAD